MKRSLIFGWSLPSFSFVFAFGAASAAAVAVAAASCFFSRKAVKLVEMLVRIVKCAQ